jgi:hypothetical protein
MEPRIQYARTSDGVNIAFWTLGEGPPLLLYSGTVSSSCQLEWNMRECRHWFEALARRHRLVAFKGVVDGVIVHAAFRCSGA